MQKSNETLWQLFEPVVNGMGFEFVGIEHIKQGRFSVVRVYVDKTGGITLNECAEVSHQLSGVLDVEEVISGSYNLEVSSPGLDRPIFKLDSFPDYLGQQIQLRLNIPVNGRRKFKGQLLQADEQSLLIAVDEQEYRIPVQDIEKANLIAEIKF